MNQEILKAIRTIVREEINNGGFDKTRTGIVATVNIDGTYSIKVDERVYPNVRSITPAQFQVGAAVKLMFPCGNINEMYIIGGSSGEIDFPETPTPELPEIYRVGDIYITTNNVNPSTIFGGTWQQIQGRFLLGADSTFTAGSTGGSKDAIVVSHNHTTTVNQQSHDHGVWYANYWAKAGTTQGSDSYLVSRMTQGSNNMDVTSSDYANISSVAVDYKGSSGTDANMPPYLVVYIWKRIA